MNLNFLSVLIILFAFWSIIRTSKLTLSYIHLMGIIFSLNLAGLYFLGLEGNDFQPMYIFGLGEVFFALGVLLKSLSRKEDFRQLHYKTNVPVIKQKNESLLILLIGLPVFVLGVMLFYRNGVPILSGNANLMRFTINEGNGFFWRMQQGGLPMMALIAGVYFMGAEKPIRRIKLLFFLFFSSTIITYVLRGHKASFFYAFLYLVLLLLVMNKGRKLSKKWVFAFISILIVSFIGMILTTQMLLSKTWDEAIGLIAMRLTTIEAMGFYNVVTVYVPNKGLQYGLAQVPSFYELLAIFRLFPRELGNLTFNQLLAHYVYGIPIWSSKFVFPITVTPFGDFYVDFGILGTLIGGFFFGVFAEALHASAIKARPSANKAFLIAFQAVMVFYASRGSIGGRLINEVLNILIIYTIYSILRKFLITLTVGKKIGMRAPRSDRISNL